MTDAEHEAWHAKHDGAECAYCGAICPRCAAENAEKNRAISARSKKRPTPKARGEYWIVQWRSKAATGVKVRRIVQVWGDGVNEMFFYHHGSEYRAYPCEYIDFRWVRRVPLY